MTLRLSPIVAWSALQHLSHDREENLERDRLGKKPLARPSLKLIILIFFEFVGPKYFLKSSSFNTGSNYIVIYIV